MLDAFSVCKGVSWLPRESKGDVNGGACPRSITGKRWTPRLPVVLDAAPTASERSGPTGPEEPPTAARPSDVQLALDLFRSCFFPRVNPRKPESSIKHFVKDNMWTTAHFHNLRRPSRQFGKKRSRSIPGNDQKSCILIFQVTAVSYTLDCDFPELETWDTHIKVWNESN